MTSPGSCPRCGSHYYTPDPEVGGAGRNVCRACNHRAPVRDFHMNANPTPLMGGRIAHVVSAGYHTGEEIISEQLSNYRVKALTLHTETPAAPIRQYKDD